LALPNISVSNEVQGAPEVTQSSVQTLTTYREAKLRDLVRKHKRALTEHFVG